MRDFAEDATTLPVRVRLGRVPLGILGTLRKARRNILEIIPDLATRQPMITGQTMRRWHMLMHPGAIRQVLRDNPDNYPKSLVTKRILEPGIGASLFLAEGAEWRWQRRAAAPVFSARNLLALAPVMEAAAGMCAARVARLDGTVGDLYEEMVAVTFEIICNVTLSGGDAMDRSAVHKAINAYILGVGRLSILDILGVPAWVPRPETILQPNAAGNLQRVADRVVAERAGRTNEPPDLLDLLIAAVDPETGRKMDPRELRDNLLAFIVAGHETTALALAWSLYLLAFDPAAQDRARAEAMEALGEDDIARAAHLEKLPFTRAVIEEAMRLYPPAAFLGRVARAEDSLAGRPVFPREAVMLPIYALHRHHMWWEEPDAFRPDRFMGTRPERFTYIPFSDGPRICIGAGFAMMEAQIVLATLLSRFRFENAGHAPYPRLLVTLRPEGGVRLRVTALARP